MSTTFSLGKLTAAVTCLCLFVAGAASTEAALVLEIDPDSFSFPTSGGSGFFDVLLKSSSASETYQIGSFSLTINESPSNPDFAFTTIGSDDRYYYDFGNTNAATRRKPTGTTTAASVTFGDSLLGSPPFITNATNFTIGRIGFTVAPTTVGSSTSLNLTLATFTGQKFVDGNPAPQPLLPGDLPTTGTTLGVVSAAAVPEPSTYALLAMMVVPFASIRLLRRLRPTPAAV